MANYRLSLGILVIALSNQSCSVLDFDSQNGTYKMGFRNPFQHITGDDGLPCSLYDISLIDSFERANVDGSDSGNKFGFRKLVDDMGRYVGSSGDRINVKTYTQTEMGPTQSGERALYFYGRPGSSVHNVYLISEPIPLDGATDFGLAFSYLPIDLETSAMGTEYLRLEVCDGTAAECGVGETVDPAALKSAKWKTVFDSSQPQQGSGLNGRNHSRADYIQQAVVIKRSELRTDKVIFRFNILLDEGFNQYLDQDPIISSGMEDGVVLDDVTAALGICQRNDDPTQF